MRSSKAGELFPAHKVFKIKKPRAMGNGPGGVIYGHDGTPTYTPVPEQSTGISEHQQPHWGEKK